MAKHPEPWGGEVHRPAWLNRRKKAPPPGDTPERAAERHNLPDAVGGKSTHQNAVDLMGAANVMMPKAPPASSASTTRTSARKTRPGRT